MLQTRVICSCRNGNPKIFYSTLFSKIRS